MDERAETVLCFALAWQRARDHLMSLASCVASDSRLHDMWSTLSRVPCPIDPCTIFVGARRPNLRVAPFETSCPESALTTALYTNNTFRITLRGAALQ